MNEAYTSATQRIGPEREPEPDGNDCALVQDLLPLYLDHEVSPESHGRIATHIAQCERCANYLAGARSMRVQLLRDQQAVRAPAPAAVPTAAHTPTGPAAAQAPVRSVRAPVQQLLTNTSSSPVGRWFLLGAGAIGALILAPIFGPLAIAAAFPIGLFVIGREIWRGVRGQSPGAPSFSTGSAGAMLAAIMSVVGVLVCAGLIFGGLVIFTESQSWDDAAHLSAILLLMFGTGGLVAINQRRGWLPQYASPSVVPELFKFILLGGGVLLAAVVVPSLLGSMPLLIIGLMLAWIFWPRNRGARP